MLRIHFAVLMLSVVTARARPEFGGTTLVQPEASNISQGCSCPCESSFQQLITLASMCESSGSPPTRPTKPTRPRREDYEYYPGVGAYKLHVNATIWNEGREICEEEGGHLAIINSQAEANVVTAVLQRKMNEIVGAFENHLCASIGFHDMYEEGEYYTIHGQSLEQAGFTGWGDFEPNNAFGNEDCGAIHWFGRLNDIACDKKYGFICELPDV